MLKYTLNQAQFDALNGLSYWIADIAYIKERCPDDVHAISKAQRTISESCFPELDKLNVPFWVQNTVICYSENWRATQSQYFTDFLKSKNIFVS